MSKDNKNTQNQKPLTRVQMSILRVMKDRSEAKTKTEEQPTYLTEAHQKNSEVAIAEIAESKKSPTDWKQESKRQKWNSQDHSPRSN